MTANDTIKTIENLAADTQKSVTAQMDKAKKSLESVSAYGQDTIDAVIKAQTVAAKAVEEIQAEVLAFTKKTIEEGVAHAKDLAASQTVSDFIEKQTGYAKDALDGFIRQSTRLNEMALAAMKDAMAPLTARVAASADLVKTQAA